MTRHEENTKKTSKKWWVWIILFVVIIAIAVNSGNNTQTQETVTINNQNDEKITLEEFNKITTGMTYQEIVAIIGGEGTVMSETSLGDKEEYHTIMYMWEGKGTLGANANVTIQGGKVVSKAQAGLD